MKKNDYFHSKNYTGNHLHVDNFKDEFSLLSKELPGKEQMAQWIYFLTI